MDRKVEQIIQHPLTLLTAICLVLVFSFSLMRNRQKAQISEDSLKQLQDNIESLESAVSNKSEQLQQSQSQLAREKIIRNELLQQQEGEIVLQIPEAELRDQLNKEEEQSDNSPLEAWKNLFFD